jgi:hypothetical protein
MFWLIIFSLVFILGVARLIHGIRENDDDSGGFGAFCIVISIASFVLWVSVGYYTWLEKAEQFKMIPVTIENKIEKIKQMKTTYYAPVDDGSQINIDMANKDLAISINNEIKDFEKYISDKNDEIINWNIKYKYRFWNACYVKPVIDKPLKLSDYKLQ